MTIQIPLSLKLLLPAALLIVCPLASQVYVSEADNGPDFRGVLYSVDAETGQRIVVTDFNDPLQGPLGSSPRDVLVLPSGMVLVADRGAGPEGRGYLFEVNPATGQRTVLSDFGDMSQGLRGDDPKGLLMETGNTVLVLDRGPNSRIFRVNLTTGFRTQLVNISDLALGPRIGFATRMAVGDDGTFWFTDRTFAPTGGGLFRVDPDTGLRQLVSDFTDPSQGPTASQASGIVFRGGKILLTAWDTFSLAWLLEVDPISGQRTIIHDLFDTEAGPNCEPIEGLLPFDIELDRDGTLLLLFGVIGPEFGGGLYRINLEDSTRETISCFGDPAQGEVARFVLGFNNSPPPEIFRDGFESGTASAWSATLP